MRSQFLVSSGLAIVRLSNSSPLALNTFTLKPASPSTCTFKFDWPLIRVTAAERWPSLDFWKSLGPNSAGASGGGGGAAAIVHGPNMSFSSFSLRPPLATIAVYFPSGRGMVSTNGGSDGSSSFFLVATTLSSSPVIVIVIGPFKLGSTPTTSDTCLSS